MAAPKLRRAKIRGFTKIGTAKVPVPKLTKKQLFAKTKFFIANPKALKVARRRGQVF